VIEDIHWADEALLAFLEHLADWAQGVPILVVCTARPELYERHGAWGSGLANQTAIRLSPLSDIETARLVAALLEQTVLPAETQQLLLERRRRESVVRGGVRPHASRPRVARRARRAAFRPDAAFPDSIQALIAARLDTLPSERKQLLQDAAVIGKVFWAGALIWMSDRNTRDVEVALHELARKELVRPSRQSSMQGEAEYGFWHALVRDVAYQQIPRRERADKHVAASAWIEEKAGDRLEDLADVLAFHVGEALAIAQSIGDAGLRDAVAPDARRFSLLAGERASGLDPARALTLLDRALELTAPDDSERAVVLLQWGRVARETGRIAEGAAALREAVDLSRSRGMSRRWFPDLVR
jgi:predicted ATPase